MRPTFHILPIFLCSTNHFQRKWKWRESWNVDFPLRNAKKREGDKKLMNNDKPTKPRFVDVVDDDDVDVDVDVEVIDEPIDQAATQIDIQRNTRIPIDKKNGIKKDFFVWLADVSFRGIPDDSPMSTMIFLNFFYFIFFLEIFWGMLSSSSSSLRGVYRLTECEGSLECLL